MFVRLVATITDPTVPSGTDAVASAASDLTSKGIFQSLADVITGVLDNLAESGYQTGIALVVATAALVAMINIGVHKLVLIPVAIGAFWAGWLGWNTFTGQDTPLFPGDVDTVKLWDVAFTSDSGFLLVAIVACAAAVFLWRKGTALPSRIVLIVGAILGASFVYNLFEALRYA